MSKSFQLTVCVCVCRGSGVGAVLALGCVGRLSSPLMDLRNHYGYFLHHVVYSSLALLAVLSILLLPESKRKPLPQTLADGEQYRRPPLGRRRRDNVPLLATPNPETLILCAASSPMRPRLLGRWRILWSCTSCAVTVCWKGSGSGFHGCS